MWSRLLHRRDQLLDHILGSGPLGRTLAELTAVMIASAGSYGAVLGNWHGAAARIV